MGSMPKAAAGETARFGIATALCRRVRASCAPRTPGGGPARWNRAGHGPCAPVRSFAFAKPCLYRDLRRAVAELKKVGGIRTPERMRASTRGTEAPRSLYR